MFDTKFSVNGHSKCNFEKKNFVGELNSLVLELTASWFFLANCTVS